MGKYLVLYMEQDSNSRWRVFDIVDSRNDHRLWYDYLQKQGFLPGLVKAEDRDWINSYVEKS